MAPMGQSAAPLTAVTPGEAQRSPGVHSRAERGCCPERRGKVWAACLTAVHQPYHSANE